MGSSHRLFRGTLRYTSNQPGRVAAERGREHFCMVTHADGRRTLSAHCEIDDPPPSGCFSQGFRRRVFSRLSRTGRPCRIL